MRTGFEKFLLRIESKWFNHFATEAHLVISLGLMITWFSDAVFLKNGGVAWENGINIMHCVIYSCWTSVVERHSLLYPKRRHLPLELSFQYTQQNRTICSGLIKKALNNVLLPTLFKVFVNKNVQHCYTWLQANSGSTLLVNNVVDNIEQCWQQNIVQCCFHQARTGCSFMAACMWIHRLAGLQIM